jgi:hypothetical protein
MTEIKPPVAESGSRYASHSALALTESALLD